MSRLAPLITRRPGSRAAALALPTEQAEPFTEAQTEAWLADLRLFVTAWLGGVVFFGTLLG
ncbi:MAG TPA: hypothetical protein VEC11_05790 [Allosphingosinicella sp.]|nr:hypothetical protein [Allosphingosinicella sp.]